MASIDTAQSNNSSNRSVTSAASAASLRTGALNAMKEGSNQRTAPFPFLEFRIVNDHANTPSRAIRNAQ